MIYNQFTLLLWPHISYCGDAFEPRLTVKAGLFGERIRHWVIHGEPCRSYQMIECEQLTKKMRHFHRRIE